MFQDIGSMQKNLLHFYKIIMNYQEMNKTIFLQLYKKNKILRK